MRVRSQIAGTDSRRWRARLRLWALGADCLAAPLWTALVVWASLAPAPPAPPPALAWDKLQHFASYMILAGLWWPLLPRGRPRLAGMTGVVVLGGALELLQAASATRYPEWLDALANLAGVLAAAGLAHASGIRAGRR